MKAIKEVMELETTVPKAPPARFDISEESIQHNSELFKSNNLDMHTLLSLHQDTTLGFGSEYLPLDQMEKVLGQHPNFGFFSDELVF
jgi:hypothetical protein